MPDLLRHYQLFRAVLFSKKFNRTLTYEIDTEVLTIAHYIKGSEFELARPMEQIAIINETRDYIVDELFQQYLGKGHHRKFNPCYSLSTWIARYIELNIKNLRRKLRPRSSAESMAKDSDIHDNRNKNFRASFEEYETWLEMATCSSDPESILSAKQLLNITIGFFGELNTLVLLGMVSRKDAVEASGLNYDQYAKRLAGMRDLFISHLYKINYLPV